MKKIMGSALLLLSLNLYGITLEDMIFEVESEGYSREFKEIEKRKLEIEEKKIDRIDRDGVEVDGSSTYQSADNYDAFDSSLNANYDFLAYKAQWDHENGGRDREWIGVEKELKDLFYSERETSQKVFGFEREIRLNSQEEDIEGDIVSLITLYKSYMDNLLELELLESLHPNIVTEYNTLKLKYEIGVAQEVDYLYSEVRVENSLADIAQLKNDLQRDRVEFYRLYKIDLAGREVQRPDSGLALNEGYLTKVGSRDLSTIDYKISSTEENLKYSKYDNRWPDLTGGVYYDNLNDGSVISLGLKKSFGEYDDTSLLYEKDMEELRLERVQKENEVENTQRTLLTQYENLVKERSSLERSLRVDKMQSDIYKLRYEQGTSSYIDYVEKYDTFVETAISHEKAKNAVYALVHEIKYRR